jgi:hypothetical protein
MPSLISWAPAGRSACGRRALIAHAGPAPRALDPLLVAAAFEDALDEDPRRVDLVGVELADLDQLLDLGDRDPAGHRGERVEVAGGLAVDEVAQRSPAKP